MLTRCSWALLCVALVVSGCGNQGQSEIRRRETSSLDRDAQSGRTGGTSNVGVAPMDEQAQGAPTISGVSPNRLSRKGSVSFSITGSGLSDCRVYLAGSGAEFELPSDGSNDASEIVFNNRRLEDVQAGTYDVIVRRGDGLHAMAPAALTIDP